GRLRFMQTALGFSDCLHDRCLAGCVLVDAYAEIDFFRARVVSEHRHEHQDAVGCSRIKCLKHENLLHKPAQPSPKSTCSATSMRMGRTEGSCMLQLGGGRRAGERSS